MKTLKFILSVLLLLPISPVFAQQDVAGNYHLIGAGCRDSELSESSHEDRPINPDPSILMPFFRITAIQLTFNRDGSLATTVEGDDGSETYKETYRIQNTGTYVVENNEVVANNGPRPFVLNIVGDNLVYDFKRNGFRDYVNATICDSSDKVFVHVFGSI